MHPILEAAKKNKMGIVVSLALSSRMRIGELLALKWSDIDFQNQTLVVRRTIARRKNYGADGGKTAIYISEPKTANSIRVIPLDNIMIKELEAHRVMQSQERELLGEGYLENDFVFASPFGGHIEPRTYQDTFKNIVKDSGIKDANFHAMRHTFATRALEIGIPAKIVAEILGHANVATTLHLYSHVSVDAKRDAINKMAQAFKAL